MGTQDDNCMMCLVANEQFKGQWKQNKDSGAYELQPAADIKKKKINVFCTLREFTASSCCEAEYADDGSVGFVGDSATSEVCTKGHCSWHENKMIGTKEQISNANVHQMYTMCMMIEDKRLLEDREFDMVS